MTYEKFIFEAKKTISQLDNGVWYLEPEWKDTICRGVTSKIEDLEDSYISDWWDVENILRLEVDKRNAQDSKKNDVINWVYELITASVEPAVVAEETEYLKNLTEYLRASHAKE